MQQLTKFRLTVCRMVLLQQLSIVVTVRC